MAINLGDSEQEAQWRSEVREFIEAEGKPLFAKSSSGEGENALFGRMGAIKQWRERVAAKGWVAPSWPKKYGGAEMSVAEQFIMNEEFAEAGVPSNVGGFGVMMIGPTIIEHGT
jgi:alkylation response protein AidB-like acyl-CoA dehydrogenase